MKWTSSEVNELARAYRSAPSADLLKLDVLAKRFNRNKSNVCRKARALGLTSLSRKKIAQPQLKQGPRYGSDEERAAATSVRMKALFEKNGHPRGMLGKKHTPETKAKISAASARAWADPLSVFNSLAFKQAASDAMLVNILAGKMNAGHSRARGGRRADLDGKYFRSAWEANYARFLNLLVAKREISKWEFECKTFVFESIKRGTRAYTPDFKVTGLDGTYVWHEVKGWMDQPSRTRLARMAKYFPEEKIIIIDASWFKSANKILPGVVAHWESGTTR